MVSRASLVLVRPTVASALVHLGFMRCFAVHSPNSIGAGSRHYGAATGFWCLFAGVRCGRCVLNHQKKTKLLQAGQYVLEHQGCSKLDTKFVVNAILPPFREGWKSLYFREQESGIVWPSWLKLQLTMPSGWSCLQHVVTDIISFDSLQVVPMAPGRSEALSLCRFLGLSFSGGQQICPVFFGFLLFSLCEDNMPVAKSTSEC